MRTTSIRLPDALYKKIQEQAEKEVRSFNGQLIVNLTHYFELIGSPLILEKEDAPDENQSQL